MCYPCTKCGRCGKYKKGNPCYTPPATIFCFTCGGEVDPQTGVCTSCGDQVFAPIKVDESSLTDEPLEGSPS